MKHLLFVLSVLFLCRNLFGEDGSALWLRYAALTAKSVDLTTVACSETGALFTSAISELTRAAQSLTGSPMSQVTTETNVGVVIGTDQGLPGKILSSAEFSGIKTEGFIVKVDGERVIIAGKDAAGVLYGVFNFLTQIQTKTTVQTITSNPAYQVRVQNHWANLDDSVERGYAGKSIWQWNSLPNTVNARIGQYARANAAVGINGAVLNNVNADKNALSTSNLAKVKAVADELRKWNVKTYLSVNFDSPESVGGQSTADPLNSGVQSWWASKADEIYKAIPDFGGFLVKANSEGRPGPQDYGRTHADGANMLAKALAPHGGIVMWRAFVYSASASDRAKQAQEEFQSLDGKFADNVLIQIKNGPIDFQPREPPSPLFGAMKTTQCMVEVQITQEYLGSSNHLVFLAPMWSEVLKYDLRTSGAGSTIGALTDGSVKSQKVTAFAGVSNIGMDTTWCGHHFAAANWYAFGRLGWDYTLSPETIADEWIRLTWSNEAAFVDPIKKLMVGSHEDTVSVMGPLGLVHQMMVDGHYGPQPWDASGSRADWRPVYYSNADSQGMGFDRTSSGSNFVGQYASEIGSQFASLTQCPEKYFLFFHHAAWTYKLPSGDTLWDALCKTEQAGLDNIRTYTKTWDDMSQYVDSTRFGQVAHKIGLQVSDAKWWYDAILGYFQSFSNINLPAGNEKFERSLATLKGITYNLTPTNWPGNVPT